jgi:DNA-binding CsgD family transcriptional regulator
MKIDPFVNLPEGRVTSSYEYIGAMGSDQAAAYHDWLREIEGSHILGVDLKISSGFEARLRLCRNAGGGPFSSEERSFVEVILPHLRRTIELFQRLAAARSEHLILVEAVEQFSVGTILLDHKLSVIRLNEVAAAILAEADGIRLVGKTVAFDDSSKSMKLRVFVNAVAAGNLKENRSVIMIERPSGRRELALMVKPVTLPNFMHTGQAPAVALFLTDPGRQRKVEPEIVRKIFSFTPAEADVASALANGCSVSDTAELLGIAITTVRAHLRSIFSKLGVGRQSQLVHLIHTSTPEAYGLSSEAKP